jgi:AcrR family transcriptional regulator
MTGELSEGVLMGATLSGRRARLHAATREEVKAIALRQLAAGGIAALSLNAIGREMGLTGPALYRYFASRDALLTDLIVDAYADLAASVEAVAQADDGADAASSLRAFAAAYRGWALAQPSRYLLLYGTPVPGYVAPPETVVLARRIMAPLLDALVALPLPTVAPAAPLAALDAQFAAWSEAGGQAGGGAALRRGVTCWTRLHGLLGLELAGHFAGMGFDPALLYDAEVDALLGVGG